MDFPLPEIRARMTAKERGELMQARATTLFAHQGYATTSVNEIVAAAGVTKPIMYKYFDSKQELGVHLLQRHRQELIDAAVSELDPEQPRDVQVERMIDAWLTWTQAHADAVRFLFTPIHGDEVVERTQAELHDRGRQTQAALIRQFAPDMPDALVAAQAEVTFAGLTAVALWLGDDETRREAAHTALVRLVLGVVDGSPG